MRASSERRPVALPQRPAFDLAGMAASILGLVGVTYGLIRAGEDGWTNPGAILAIVAGMAVLVGFLAWERAG
jgi:MFS transporter, DHA2 family, multidrug resistance protein